MKLDLLDQVDLTLEKVKVFRQLGQQGKAEEILQPRIEDLESALRLMEQREHDGKLANYEIEGRNRIASKLANCYGIRGGLQRRNGALKDALSSYQHGREIEQDPQYGISDSYNLVNELLLSILNRPAAIDSLGARIKDAESIVAKQVRADRHDQWWAWADLGMLNLLAGNPTEAEHAYKRYWAEGARDSDFASTRAALEQCRDALADVAPDISKSITLMIDKILEMKSMR
jgi:hypothetical protein